MLMLPLASVGQGKKEQVCAIRGAIYYTTFRQQADFTIFVEDSPDFADMQVYKERQRLFADKPGLWHFVDHPHLADYILFVEQNRSAADFTIAYTPTQSFAGCK
jgi:hypothetical protein